MHISQHNSVIPVTYPDVIQEHISLADKNWFKTGGNARFYAQPKTILEFQQALSFAHTHDLPIFILGKGANILISDEGFDGLVIHPALLQMSQETVIDDTVLVTVESGVDFGDLINWCLDHQIIGLEEFSGIPGSVGGSVFINIHYFEFLLSHFLQSAVVINKQTGAVTQVDASWFQFGYNTSFLHQETHYLISATFKLKKVSAQVSEYARGRSHEMIRHRMKRYPYSGTCGSFFRNFHDHEVTMMSLGKKLIFVAYYLDQLGIKGELSVGSATVSYQHANMLVNKGTATSTDIITLARTMQEMVYKRFNIIPQAECRLIGFKQYPLL